MEKNVMEKKIVSGSSSRRSEVASTEKRIYVAPAMAAIPFTATKNGSTSSTDSANEGFKAGS